MSFDTDENRPSKVYATNYHPTPPPQGKKSIDWFLSNPASIPSPMRYWIVFSTARMFTRPVIHRYLFSRSPWRFSSAVHARVQRAQAVWSDLRFL